MANKRTGPALRIRLCGISMHVLVDIQSDLLLIKYLVIILLLKIWLPRSYIILTSPYVTTGRVAATTTFATAKMKKLLVVDIT